MDSNFERHSDNSYQPKGAFFLAFLFFAGILLPIVWFIAEIVNSISFVGGTDAVSAFETAADLASQKPNLAILWLHKPQII
jgi:hypothetical protein